MSGRSEHERNRGRAGSPRGSRRSVLLLGAGALTAAAAVAILLWLPGRASVSHAYALAPESALPANLRNAPPTVREAYRFAIANRDVLRQIPCYCGCGDQHQSNADCYIKDVKADGRVEFDLMSYG